MPKITLRLKLGCLDWDRYLGWRCLICKTGLSGNIVVRIFHCLEHFGLGLLLQFIVQDY
jgi:hypothetical protein